MRRTRAPRAEVKLPAAPAHWHPPGCDCEPAIPYIRVSKVGERNPETLLAPELQLGTMDAYARRKNLRLLDPVCDIDKSGRTFRKRSVDGIITSIEKGGPKRILLWKWSRWARNTYESTKYLARVRKVGGRVDSATEDFDQDTAIGRFQMGLVMQVDQYQSEAMGETWQAVHSHRRGNGLPHAGRARFGYDYVGKRYVPNYDEGPALAKAYDIYVDGGSFGDILGHFQAAGLPTTMGGEWTKQSIARMMDTGFAAGLIRERSTPGEKPANSIQSYDIWREGSHEALISIDTWNRYKARRLAQAQIPPRARRAEHALSALLFCDECGHRATTHYAGPGRSHQWHCSWRKAFHSGVSIEVNNRLALEAVREWVRRTVGEARDIGQQEAAAYAELERAARDDDDEQARIEVQIGRLRTKIERLIDMHEEGDITKEQYRQRKAARQAEIAALESQLKPKKRQPGRPDAETVKKLVDLDEVWDELVEHPTRLNRVLGTLVSRIEVRQRSEASSRKSAADRVFPIGWWEEPELDDWVASRKRRSA